MKKSDQFKYCDDGIFESCRTLMKRFVYGFTLLIFTGFAVAGNLTINVEMQGPKLNDILFIDEHRIELYGPGVYDTAAFPRTGEHTFSNLSSGDYRMNLTTSFSELQRNLPVSTSFISRQTQLTLQIGQDTQFTFEKDTALIVVGLSFQGLWNLFDVENDSSWNSSVTMTNYTEAPPNYYPSYQADVISFSPIDRLGNFVSVLYPNDAFMQSWYLSWSENNTNWYVARSYYTGPTVSPVLITQSMFEEPAYLFSQELLISSLDISTSEIVLQFDASENNQEFTRIFIDARDAQGSKRLRTTFDSSSNPSQLLSVIVRGEEGDYSGNVTLTYSDNTNQVLPISFSLGTVNETPIGEDVVQEFSDSEGQLVFDNVTSSGSTTISTTSEGPATPSGFKVFGDGVEQYYEDRKSTRLNSSH